MNNRQKAFIILTPGFAASETDTTCLPMQQAFVKSISKMYPQVDVIVLSFQYPFCNKRYKWFESTVTSFNGRNKGGLSKIFLRRKVNKTLTTLHKTKQVVGLVSFWLGECAYVGKKFAERNGLAHYCWLLGQDARANNKYMEKISAKSNELIALSDFLQGEFEMNYGIKPFAVIPPGIEEKPLTEVPRDIDLLAVGSLIPLKQFGIFIETVATIKKQLPGVRAVLVGDGPERNKLDNLIEAFGVKDNILIAGKIDHEEVINMMQRAKILLHPSSYEGYPGVCQEALCSGAYVISFCKPMNENILQWHIVNSKMDMIQKTLSILQDTSIEYKQVSFQPMDFTAKQVMDLF